MSLKQSIVVVNEFSVKNKSGKGGSRGGTPGNYVLRYMARNEATEDLTPVRFDSEYYIERYMARESATEKAGSVPELKQDMRDIQGLGGIAFGNGDVSLSHKKLKEISKDIQDQFESGKTVMKTVLSFDEDYLKQNNVIDKDFEFTRRGCYRGNLDQMKLRMAVMNGMNRLSRNYDDLSYVGVIQVDTAHVHCHLAMVDRGEGTLASDGTQKGMISGAGKRELRRGIDLFLDESKTIQRMSSNVTHDRRNALCFIKKFTHSMMDEHGAPQFMLACLPEDRSLWRAATNRIEMRKANAVVREFVMNVLNSKGSGYPEARRDIDAYARERKSREGLSDTEYIKLRRNGEERLIQDCMNGVYSVLKKIPESELRVRTPLLDSMSLDYGDMASRQEEDPVVEFGFRLRSYSSRLEHHKKESEKYHAAVKTYESLPKVSESSKALYNFFLNEREYNDKLVSKYQHFLMFLPDAKDYKDDFDEVMAGAKKCRMSRKLFEDESPRRMSKENAEDYGLRVYDVAGGQLLTFNPGVFEARLILQEQEQKEREEEFKRKLALRGLQFDGHGVKPGIQYDFDSVKALDIHHLSYDFPEDFPISKVNADEFIREADKRFELYNQAVDYLNGSGQAFAVNSLPGRDIEVMHEVADGLRLTPVVHTAKPVTGGRKKGSKTVTLDSDYVTGMKTAVRAAVNSMQLGGE